jgi:hypothetical protein
MARTGLFTSCRILHLPNNFQSQKFVIKKNTITQDHIHRIVTGFEGGTLPKEEWTHEAHLIMALYYVLNLDANAVLSHIRSGIIRYNESVGTANTATSGYHETLTVFYVQEVLRFLEHTDRTQPIAILAQELLASETAERSYPLRFYTKERLFSSEARAMYVAPDSEHIQDLAHV